MSRNSTNAMAVRQNLSRCPMLRTRRLTPLILSLLCASAIADGFSTSDGLEKRARWTSSRFRGSPDPPLPYTTEAAFPSLTFTNCLDLAALPGSERLVVVEQAGKIFSFPNRRDVKSADLVIDLAQAIEGVEQCYAIALDPNFLENRYCYVCYIKQADQPDGTHVARFRIVESEPPSIDASSEQTIVTWRSGGHNGCCLKFGPDGFLYISAGDAGPANPPDPLQAGQDLSNVLSTIMRVDVHGDDFPANDQLNFRIPSDNPFVNLDGARGEIWAYGLRNPWRMSFDQRTGDLWVGDVGWELWEMIYRVQRGGNYGWAITEGRQSVHPEWARGPTEILSPTIDHPHSESSSITDGLTYYGDRLPELHGAHIYGDFDTGKFWGFRFEDGQVVDHQELADTSLRIVGFGEDHRGEFYILDHAGGTIHRLIPNSIASQSNDFPRMLSSTGLFDSIADRRPAPGVVPYTINATPWADNADSDRWIAIPGEGQVQPAEPAWSFPTDTVLVKTLNLEMEKGVESSRRPIETQVLHFNGISWQPYTYRWNEEQSDAVLVGAAGAEMTVRVVDAQAPGGSRQQSWRFAGRAECQRCHNRWSGPPLGFNASQLGRQHYDGDTHRDQLEALAQSGIIEQSLASSGKRLVNPRDASADLTDRARSYLHVNCAHCHRKHAGSAVLSKMPYDVPIDQTDMIDVRPTQGAFGIHGAKVIATGDPYRSIVWYRMAKLGSGRMPYLGSSEIDMDGLELIHNWIVQLAGKPTELTSRTTTQVAELSTKVGAPEFNAGVSDFLASTGGALRLMRSIDEGSIPAQMADRIVSTASRHDNASIRDLFERYLPSDQRTKRLSGNVSPDQILALPGNAVRGEAVFFDAIGIQCKNCHVIDSLAGRHDANPQRPEIGPNLSKIGLKYNRRQLLESILEPSKQIDPKYVTYLVETKDGGVLTGLLVNKSERGVILKDGQGNVSHIEKDNVEQLVPQRQSLMPEMLMREMTARQAADLIEFLSSLK